MEAFVTYEGSPPVAVIELAGELDLSERDRMRRLCDDALRSCPSGVVLDLSDITFLDSAGVETLVRARRVSRDAGVPLALVGAQDTYVVGKFRRMGVLDGADLPLSQDRPSAIASVRGNG